VDGRAKVAKRELRRCLAPALGAVLDMAPTPEQAGALGVEQHDERLRKRVDLHSVAGLPLGGCRTGVMICALYDPAKSRVLHVDDPRTVARLDDDLFHGNKYPMN
jgi:hypothetical protein